MVVEPKIIEKPLVGRAIEEEKTIVTVPLLHQWLASIDNDKPLNTIVQKPLTIQLC